LVAASSAGVNLQVTAHYVEHQGENDSGQRREGLQL